MTLKHSIKKNMEKNFPGFFVESRSTKINKIRQFSGHFRILPDFIMIGAQKCGTTSLYGYLSQHPEIEPAITKAPHYFDTNYEKSSIWYKAHFISKFKQVFYKKILKKQIVTGEASTDYINHPLVPERIKKLVPNVKIIITLRNPIDRTYSHYNMNKNNDDEKLAIMPALKKDLEQLHINEEVVKRDKLKFSEYFKRFEYLPRGEYAKQIQEWEKYFHRDQMLIIKLEDLKNEPQKTVNRIFKFLNVKEYNLINFEKKNVGKYKEIESDVKKFLEDYFREHNKTLFEKYGIKF